MIDDRNLLLVDQENKADEINNYLETLRINQKLEINDGVFRTTSTSSQKF